jgi:hypothetical protein
LGIVSTEPDLEGQSQSGQSERGCLAGILWAIGLIAAFAVNCIAGAGLLTPIYDFDGAVQQLHADLAPGRMSGTLYVTRCSPVVKDVGRGERETFYRCAGDFFPRSGAPRIADVALISDLRRIPVTATVHVSVVPGDSRAYRPWPLGFMYTLALIATPLLVCCVGLWLFTKRRRLAYCGLGVAMLLALASEVAQQTWVGW